MEELKSVAYAVSEELLAARASGNYCTAHVRFARGWFLVSVWTNELERSLECALERRSDWEPIVLKRADLTDCTDMAFTTRVLVFLCLEECRRLGVGLPVMVNSRKLALDRPGDSYANAVELWPWTLLDTYVRYANR
jgi:hypothetical protein